MSRNDMRDWKIKKIWRVATKDKVGGKVFKNQKHNDTCRQESGQGHERLKDTKMQNLLAKPVFLSLFIAGGRC